MIYLIITACLNNNWGVKDFEHRKKTYIESITQMLNVLPRGIIPIIVENNGQRKTFLDDFGTNILYTNNNSIIFPHKSCN